MDKMTNNQTITWVIILVFYFVITTIVLSAVQNDVPIKSDGENYSFCKNITCTEKTYFGNLVTNLSDLPVWFNLVFLGIPFTMLILFVILLLVHG